jgi:ribonuclease HII
MSREPIDSVGARLSMASREQIENLLRELEADPRAGVRALAQAERRRIARRDGESTRLTRLTRHQVALHDAGFAIVAGTDEVGRGALAGPVTGGAVIMDVACRIEGLDDSKKLAPRRRESVAAIIRQVAVAVAVAHVPSTEIDAIGIGPASRLAMTRALEALGLAIDHVLVDGNDGRVGWPSTAVIKGDSLCACIAAASVVAKVERDALMVRLAVDYPGYGLDVNKGYSTEEHMAAIRRLGPCAIHRRSFAPCAEQGLLFE